MARGRRQHGAHRSDGPLARVVMRHRTISLSELRRNDDDPWDLDPPYQRGHVWGVERQRALARSVFEGIPLGAIFLNRRGGPTSDAVVVDGKQRITALRALMEGRLRFPASWIAPESRTGAPDAEGMICWSDLTSTMQRVTRLETTLGVYETALASEAEEAALFARINFGGLAQGERDADAPADSPR